MTIFLLHQALDKAAERFPDREAYRCRTASLTYAEAAIKTNSLARLLVERGLQPRDRVGVYLNKSLESALAIFGVMKAGGAYVPLDPTAPVARIEFVIRDCGIRHLITDTGRTTALRQLAENGVELESVIGPSLPDDLAYPAVIWDEVFAQPGNTFPAVHAIEQDLAYVMYTSGSTGSPKGIMHTHHSGLSYAKSIAEVYNLRPEDRIANHAPLHFDISTFDFFGGPLAGSAVIIVPEEYTKLPASFSQLLEKEKASVIFTVPFALIQLLLRGALDKRDLSAMRWVIYGGEPFPTKHLRALMKALPGAQFSNIYGPAEVNGVTYYHVPQLPEDSDDPVPIGQMFPFAQAIVVSAEGDLVDRGSTGEMLIRSPTMMQGYWGRPDLNREAFFRRPIFADYEEIYYRTGDLVEQRADGNYMFLGRKDRQIKTRGYRVELDEVEAALTSHEDVEESAVFPIADGHGSRQIESAVILRPGAVVEAGVLSQYLGALLPWYAVPVSIEIMPSFPRTTSGKTDRRALAERATAKKELELGD